MILFHYTTASAIQQIRKDGVIRKSVGNILINNTVSLTTDTDPRGHGLPDGREITMAQAQHLNPISRNGKLYCHDHTEFRIVLSIPQKDPLLAPAWMRNKPDELLGMDIAAWNPIDVRIPDCELLDIHRKIMTNALPRKSKTWWYYLTDIPCSLIDRLEVRNSSGVYVPSAWTSDS